MYHSIIRHHPFHYSSPRRGRGDHQTPPPRALAGAWHGHVVPRPQQRHRGRRRRRELPRVRHGGARLPRLRLLHHRLHRGRLLPPRRRAARLHVRPWRSAGRSRWRRRCWQHARAGAVRARRDPQVRVPEGRRGRRRVGAVRDLPRRGARRRGCAAAAGMQAPVPRGVRRHVAVLARHVPALPARRRRRCRRGRRQSLAEPWIRIPAARARDRTRRSRRFIWLRLHLPS